MSKHEEPAFLSASPRQLLVLLAVFAMVLGYYGYTRYGLRQHRADLDVHAEKTLDQFFEGLPRDDFDAFTVVENDLAYGFFGKEWGTVRLYLRKRVDAGMASFQGYEYFYEYTDEGWTRNDTAQMKDPKDWIAAYELFEARGYSVEPAAYDRLLDRIR